MESKSQLMILACFCILISGQLVSGVCDPATETARSTFIGCAGTAACVSIPPGIVGDFDAFAQLGGPACTVTVASNVATAAGLAADDFCFGILSTCISIGTGTAVDSDSSDSSIGSSSSR